MMVHSAIFVFLLVIVVLMFRRESGFARYSEEEEHSDIAVLDTEPFGKVNISTTLSRNIKYRFELPFL